MSEFKDQLPADGPTDEEVVTLLFNAAMSGDVDAFTTKHELDPKLLQMWKHTHAQEYIAFLEKLLRVIRKRAEA